MYWLVHCAVQWSSFLASLLTLSKLIRLLNQLCACLFGVVGMTNIFRVFVYPSVLLRTQLAHHREKFSYRISLLFTLVDLSSLLKSENSNEPNIVTLWASERCFFATQWKNRFFHWFCKSFVKWLIENDSFGRWTLTSSLWYTLIILYWMNHKLFS